jgi:hypothetical protein
MMYVNFRSSRVFSYFFQGTSIDLFRGKAQVREQEEEKYPSQLNRVMKVGDRHTIIIYLENERIRSSSVSKHT